MKKESQTLEEELAKGFRPNPLRKQTSYEEWLRNLAARLVHHMNVEKLKEDGYHKACSCRSPEGMCKNCHFLICKYIDLPPETKVQYRKLAEPFHRLYFEEIKLLLYAVEGASRLQNYIEHGTSIKMPYTMPATKDRATVIIDIVKEAYLEEERQ